MNAAKVSGSKRLQRVQRLLAKGGWHSTRDIVSEAQVCAVNSCVAELRDGGAEIECKIFTDHTGERRFYYRMTKTAEETDGTK